MRVKVKNLMRKSQPFNHFILFLLECYVATIHAKNSYLFKWQNKHSPDGKLKINLGSGKATKSGFFNIDFCKGVDIRVDLRKRLPLRDESCELVYSEHFVEHLVYPEGVEKHFSDCYRVLCSRGKISISVPDTEWPLKDYALSRTKYLDACIENKWHPDDCETFMEHINYHFRQRWRGENINRFNCHRFAWDFETMEKKLNEQGFINITRREFDATLDSVHRKEGSLFVEAFKP